MVLQLSTRTPVQYEYNLTRFIHTESQKENPSILFLNCHSTLTKYLLSRPELQSTFECVSLIHTPTLNDLLFTLKSVPFAQQLHGKRFIFISPFYHLFSHFSAWKQKSFLLQIENRFEKIEKKYPVHIVVAEE